MSDETEDGGPAFPWQVGQLSGGMSGMSLRDWFAGQALAGLTDMGANGAAATAYALADAMLAARRGSSSEEEK